MRRGAFSIDALFAAIDARRRSEGLSWAELGRAIGGISPSTLSGMRTRRAIEGDGVLQMLRWLGRTPESFLSGWNGTVRDAERLPVLRGPGVLRFNARAVYDAIDARRGTRSLTWKQVATETGTNAGAMTRLRHGGRVSFPEVMRLFQWLGQPAARFVHVTMS